MVSNNVQGSVMRGITIAVVVASAACHKPVPVELDSRIYSQTPSCLIGNIIVEDTTTHELSCQPFKPTLNRPQCDNWPGDPPASQHLSIVDALAALSGPMPQRRQLLTNEDWKKRVHVNARGQVMLVSNAIGADLSLPKGDIKVGASYKHLDLLVDVSPLTVKLTPGEADCLASQPGASIDAMFPNQTTRGYVDEAVLGFVNRLALTDAKIESQGGNVVKISASEFTLDSHTHGLVEQSYLEELRKLLNGLQGTDSAINATRISLYADKVTQVATTFLTIKPFARTPPLSAAGPSAPHLQ